MKVKTLNDIIRKYSKEMKEYISQFGKGKNRDIDTREKGTMIMIPLIIQKRVKVEAIKMLKKEYHPDKTTIPISAFLDFHNLTEEDLE